jgi:hypothetical protein
MKFNFKNIFLGVILGIFTLNTLGASAPKPLCLKQVCFWFTSLKPTNKNTKATYDVFDKNQKKIDQLTIDDVNDARKIELKAGNDFSNEGIFELVAENISDDKNQVNDYWIFSKTKKKFLYLGRYLALSKNQNDEKLFTLAFGRGYPEFTREEYRLIKDSLFLQRRIVFSGDDICFAADSAECKISALITNYALDGKTTTELTLKNVPDALAQACSEVGKHAVCKIGM